MNSTTDNLLRGLLGMVFLILVCYILSNNRKAINWKLVIMGIVAQVMFAMGVLHTTAFGQPVFWMFFGLILVYTIIRKISDGTSGEKPLTYQTSDLALSVLWQALFVGALILAPALFGTWTNLAMTIGSFTILWIAFSMGNRHPELLKWNILISSVVVTVCVYTKVCRPDLFRAVLESSSNVFVELINISHKGTEFLFGKLADETDHSPRRIVKKTVWQWFASQKNLLPNI